MQIGAYIIYLPSGHFYVGQSANWRIRKIRHRHNLKKGIHVAKKLQENYREGDVVNVELYPTETQEQAEALEAMFISLHWGNPLLCNTIKTDEPGLHRRGMIASDATKRKMSEVRKGVAKPEGWGAKIAKANGFIIEVGGVRYSSAIEVSKVFKVSVRTVLMRCRSDSGRFPEWKIISMASREKK